MDYGVMLPFMRPPTRTALADWARRIDEGPFEYAAIGERILYDTGDQGAMLAGAAMLTERVKLLAYVSLLSVHNPTLFAKRMATIDILSEGRLLLSVGVGNKPYDYAACGLDYADRYRLLRTALDEIQRLWTGEPAVECSDPLGPPPFREGGPPLFWGGGNPEPGKKAVATQERSVGGAVGPKALQRATKWASGFTSFWGATAVPEQLYEYYKQVQDALKAAARTDEPPITTSIFFSLSPDADGEMKRTIQRYVSYYDKHDARPGEADEIVSGMTITSPEALLKGLDHIEAAGYDAVIFLPVTTDIAEMDRLERVLEQRVIPPRSSVAQK